jgi:hypothetical protein
MTATLRPAVHLLDAEGGSERVLPRWVILRRWDDIEADRNVLVFAISDQFEPIARESMVNE